MKGLETGSGAQQTGLQGGGTQDEWRSRGNDVERWADWAGITIWRGGCGEAESWLRCSWRGSAQAPHLSPLSQSQTTQTHGERESERDRKSLQSRLCSRGRCNKRLFMKINRNEHNCYNGPGILISFSFLAFLIHWCGKTCTSCHSSLWWAKEWTWWASAVLLFFFFFFYCIVFFLNSLVLDFLLPFWISLSIWIDFFGFDLCLGHFPINL